MINNCLIKFVLTVKEMGVVNILVKYVDIIVSILAKFVDIMVNDNREYTGKFGKYNGEYLIEFDSKDLCKN